MHRITTGEIIFLIWLGILFIFMLIFWILLVLQNFKENGKFCKWFGHKYVEKKWISSTSINYSKNCKRCRRYGSGGSTIKMDDNKAADGFCIALGIDSFASGGEGGVEENGHGGKGGDAIALGGGIAIGGKGGDAT